MIKVTILECDTTDEFDRCIIKLNNKEVAKSIVISEPENGAYGVSDIGEVDGIEFERLMSVKGYRVMSIRAKKNHCERFNIRMEKRHKNWKYKLEDIQRVPAKRGFPKKFMTQPVTLT